MISFHQLSIHTANGKAIVHPFGGQFAPGQFHVVCGPNGSGKTTLLRALCGLQTYSGEIYYGNHSLAALSEQKRAAFVSWLPAEQPIQFGYSVREVVSWGRWSKHFGSPKADDIHHVNAAIAAMKLEAFSHRPVTELSLGELKRVHFARAIAADTPSIILDEPCGPLDVGVSLDVMAWIKSSGKTVIASLHDLSLVINFADTVLLLNEGRSLGHGKPSEILTQENLRTAFGVSLHQIVQGDKRLIFLTR